MFSKPPQQIGIPLLLCCLLGPRAGADGIRSAAPPAAPLRLTISEQIENDALQAFVHQPSGQRIFNRPGLRAALSVRRLRLLPADADLATPTEGLAWWLDVIPQSVSSQDIDALAPAALSHRGAEAVAKRGAWFEHRLQNRRAAIEQSFFIRRDFGPSLSLELKLSGPLRPSLVQGRLVLSAASGPVLSASAPRAFGADGQAARATYDLRGDRLFIRVAGVGRYPLLIDPAWESVGEDRQGAWYGWAVAAAGDVNRDGLADVLISAPFFGTANPSAGKIYLYYGQADGLAATPAWQSSGDDQNRALFGWALGAADVNGDGYSDLIVGAPSREGAGKAFVFHGSFNGPLPPSWTAVGDGQVGAYFGTAVASVGDTNGDGYDDVLVGAPAESFLSGPSTDPGKAFLYLGSAAGLGAQAAWSSSGEDQAGAGFGWALAAAGDVNNDGYGDALIGANLFDLDYTDTGRAYLFLGTAGGLAATPSWAESGDAQAYAQFGWSVAGGDLDRDLYSDALIGAPGHDTPTNGAGRVYAYRGGNAQTGLAAAYWWSDKGGDRAMAQFGWSVSAAGDLNDDGYADAAVGAPGDGTAGTGAGRFYLFNGSVGGPQAPAAFEDSGDAQTAAAFGGALAHVGDVNGDGADDLLVGAYMADQTSQDSGKAFLYLGTPGGGPGVCEPPGTPCDDGQDCTHTDVCDGDGVCHGQAFSCDDQNPCTDDLCRPDGSCSQLHNQNPCDDGDPCTDNDVCAATVCRGAERDCSWLNDGCKQGACDPASGQCQPFNAPDGTACDDADPCTSDSRCTGGVCVHHTYTCGQGEDGCGCGSSAPATGPGLLLLGLLIFTRRRRT